MPNPYGNPNIAHYGRNTRFGMPDACPPERAQQRAIQQRSLRHALRVACSKRVIDLDHPVLTKQQVWGLFGYRPGDRLSPAQFMAAQLILKGIAGDLDAARIIEYTLDGRPQ